MECLEQPFIGLSCLTIGSETKYTNQQSREGRADSGNPPLKHRQPSLRIDGCEAGDDGDEGDDGDDGEAEDGGDGGVADP